MAGTVSNLLLSAYAREAGTSPYVRFEAVPLPHRTVVYREQETPRYVHFLSSGVASVVALLEEGAQVEVSMTGNEGVPEAVYLLGPEQPHRTCFMQVEGTAHRMLFSEFARWFEEDAILRRLVLRTMQFQNLMATQLAACNGQHDTEQRLARWLLMVQDRVEAPMLPLTQEFLGQMLGARRSTVTIAASNLQRAGMIDYLRGQVRVVNRELLRETACECYGVIDGLRARLFEGLAGR